MEASIKKSNAKNDFFDNAWNISLKIALLMRIPQADPLFFWMQEVEETTDEEVAKKINEALGVAGTTEPAVQLDNNQVFSN